MLKHLGLFTGLIAILFLSSCTKDDRKEVKQTIDSASTEAGS